MMSTLPESATRSGIDAHSPPAARWPLGALALLSLLAGGLSWTGGWSAVAATAALGVTALLVGVQSLKHAADARRWSSTAQPAPEAPRAAAAAPKTEPLSDLQSQGQAVMISSILPVWSRQLDVTRNTSDTGLSQVLQSFTDMNAALDALMANLQGLGGASAPGAIDAAVHDSSPALEALARPALLACDMREKVLEQLNHCATDAVQLEQLAHQIKELGRHTRLLAFNASIEANRNGKADAGSGAVASEMRALAGRMGQSGGELERLATTQRARLDEAVRQAVTEQTHPTELRMEIELRAREALQLLMAAVGASLSSSTILREASTAMRDHLETAMINFQFGDRVSQMLTILSGDINRFVEWSSHHPTATRDDAVEWLRRLEASYTMDEQRSEHHGNTHVDRGSEVEFF